MDFKPETKTCKDVEIRGVAWRPNEIWYSICVAECVLSKERGNLFGYERLGFQEDVRYDELSSVQSGIDTRKTAKGPEGSTSTTQTQAKGPIGKVVTQARTSLPPGLLRAASSFAKPTTVPGKGPRPSPQTTAQSTEYCEGLQYLQLSEGKLSGSEGKFYQGHRGEGYTYAS